MTKSISMYDIPEECGDELVLISPGFLVEQHGVKKSVAVAIAERAFQICSARWPKALIRVSNGKIIDDLNGAFISIAYGVAIPHKDIDMEAWAEHGASLRSEIIDYILVRACDEACMPLPKPKKRNIQVTCDNYLELLGTAKIPKEYVRLAAEAGRNAAILKGNLYFDRHVSIPGFKTQSGKIRLELSKGMEKVVENILKAKPIQERLIADDIIKALKIDLTKDEPDQTKYILASLMTSMASEAYEAFAQTYFGCLRAYVKI